VKALLKFEPAFVESAVFWRIKSLEASGDQADVQSLNADKDNLYEQPGGEKAFRQCFENSFERLGIKGFFEAVLSERPLLDRQDVTIFIRSAFNRKQEGAELYVDGETKTVLVGVQAESVRHLQPLRVFLRHEFLRVSDMLDPSFDYSPSVSLGGRNDAENHLIRERFAALWDDDIRIRLEAVPPRRDKRLTQGQLIAMARDERVANNFKKGSFVCPLCGFGGFDRTLDWSGARKSHLATVIQSDRPDWNSTMDCCRQCSDMYQAQAVLTRER